LLEISENNDFLKERKVILKYKVVNMIEMNDLDLPFEVSVQLRPQTIGYLKVTVKDNGKPIKNTRVEIRQKMLKRFNYLFSFISL
jgi:hypothetical protein